jgi:hypothetical protein
MPHMPDPRVFKDRPLRRVGTAALIAVGVHAVVLGVGVYFFKDYVFAENVGPRLTHQRLERAVADSPILVPGTFVAGPAAPASDEPESPTVDWSQTRMSQPAWSWWSWEANPHLATRVDAPQVRKH